MARIRRKKAAKDEEEEKLAGEGEEAGTEVQEPEPAEAEAPQEAPEAAETQVPDPPAGSSSSADTSSWLVEDLLPAEPAPTPTPVEKPEEWSPYGMAEPEPEESAEEEEGDSPEELEEALTQAVRAEREGAPDSGRTPADLKAELSSLRDELEAHLRGALEGERTRSATELVEAKQALEAELEHAKQAFQSELAEAQQALQSELAEAEQRQEQTTSALARREAEREARDSAGFAEAKAEISAARDELQEALARTAGEGQQRLAVRVGKSVIELRGELAESEKRVRRELIEEVRSHAEAIGREREGLLQGLTALTQRMDVLERHLARLSKDNQDIHELLAVLSVHRAPAEPGKSWKGGVLDLNAASFEELRHVGFSATQATRVLTKRDALGGYKSVEQLREVPGLSDTALERIAPKLRA